MRKLIGIIFILCAGLVQAQTDQQGQQVYDQQGHLIFYKYPDGTRDTYTYDSSWRMVSFTSRTGESTRFSYNQDGSMLTQKASGATSTSK